MEATDKKIPISVYAESTPNPATMKFVCSLAFTEAGSSVEFHNVGETSKAPLAARLFTFPFVTGVFFSNDFITITKNDLVEWQEVFGEVRSYLFDYLSSGNDIFTENPKTITTEKQAAAEVKTDIPKAKLPESDTEKRIVEILDEYVRPAVESDGGAIDYHSYDNNGKVTVILKGSCSGCPSSSVTLKNGIQGLFNQMMPEITEVVALEA
ncbi:MAG: NifU family protein [Bacteroidetes bacterium]|jgi:Fe-S cluster biogenesis protein NfuA|nr:NifU family protein [Crocinitomicaceae bacterium]MCH9821811.1 NifU family protein [Bacteroidota bacterium]MDA9938306.1 NifU family protein [Salibacteraceae bacterium]|tara:strand:- start:57709 stop:58338 length:630 start_codon:yes stop_codon:yes gene_type:complete